MHIWSVFRFPFNWDSLSRSTACVCVRLCLCVDAMTGMPKWSDSDSPPPPYLHTCTDARARLSLVTKRFLLDFQSRRGAKWVSRAEHTSSNQPVGVGATSLGNGRHNGLLAGRQIQSRLNYEIIFFFLFLFVLLCLNSQPLVYQAGKPFHIADKFNYFPNLCLIRFCLKAAPLWLFFFLNCHL